MMIKGRYYEKGSVLEASFRFYPQPKEYFKFCRQPLAQRHYLSYHEMLLPVLVLLESNYQH